MWSQRDVWQAQAERLAIAGPTLAAPAHDVVELRSTG
jgi:hypothetical protein